MKVEIEEGIYCIETKMPLRKAIFEYKNSQITRKLFILGDSDKRNNKIDIIDSFKVELKDIESLTELEMGQKLKNMLSNCFRQNIENEMEWYKNPILK